MPTCSSHELPKLFISPLQGGGPRKGPLPTMETSVPVPLLRRVDPSPGTLPSVAPVQITPHTHYLIVDLLI